MNTFKKASELIGAVDWDKVDGLVPAIIQNEITENVLMLGYMNQESIKKTYADNKVTFFSRTKQRLWQKGESSGNFLHFVSANLDCDQDALLIKVRPQGPTCHTGSETCFGDVDSVNANFLHQLEEVIQSRKVAPTAESYTSQLFSKGINKIAQKVGEEGVETVIAGLKESDEALTNESADLLYHLLVLLAERDVSLVQVLDILKARHN